MTAKEFYKIFLRNPQICTDSRKITPGCLFFALRGDSFDGNLFAPDAIKSGAAAAIVDDPTIGGSEGCIFVSNVLEFLQELAKIHRNHLTIPVFALTGTNGKTTTKELITSVLSQRFLVNSTRGNLNNHIGVPLTILDTRHEHQVLVVEMGANHPGEIAFLSQIAMPDIGLITNIGKAHLEGFGSFEGVIKTKSELFEFVRSTGGTWIRNSDDPILDQVCGYYPGITYGTGPGSQIRGVAEVASMTLKLRINWPDGSSYPAESNLTGGYNLYNILAAASVGYHFGMDPESVIRGIADYQPSNMRSQWLKTASNTILLDAYNANPSSMSLALKHFQSVELSGKVVILGDMFELGPASRQEHDLILHQIRELGFERVYLAGKEFSAAKGYPEFRFYETTEQLIEELKSHPLSGNTILIKGSRGMKLERVVDYL